MNRRAYLYLLWIGTRGNVLPVYPWTNGSWQGPMAEEPVSQVDLPADGRKGWPMEDPSGMETLMLLRTARRCQRRLTSRRLLERLPAQGRNAARSCFASKTAASSASRSRTNGRRAFRPTIHRRSRLSDATDDPRPDGEVFPTQSSDQFCKPGGGRGAMSICGVSNRDLACTFLLASLGLALGDLGVAQQAAQPAPKKPLALRRDC